MHVHWWERWLFTGLEKKHWRISTLPYHSIRSHSFYITKIHGAYLVA